MFVKCVEDLMTLLMAVESQTLSKELSTIQREKSKTLKLCIKSKTRACDIRSRYNCPSVRIYTMRETFRWHNANPTVTTVALGRAVDRGDMTTRS